MAGLLDVLRQRTARPGVPPEVVGPATGVEQRSYASCMKLWRRAMTLTMSVLLLITGAAILGAGSAAGAVGRTAVGDQITYWFAADFNRVYATAYTYLGIKAEFHSLDRDPLVGPIQRRFDTTVILPGQRISSTITSSSGYAACAIAINGRIRTQVSVDESNRVARCF